MFQHTAARRRLANLPSSLTTSTTFQHTAARRRLAKDFYRFTNGKMFQHTAARRRLALKDGARRIETGFNTQPPEGGWYPFNLYAGLVKNVSTHSRPKAAVLQHRRDTRQIISFNTQPPEGGWGHDYPYNPPCMVSTHSRPKAAAAGLLRLYEVKGVSTHSRPKAAGHIRPLIRKLQARFQHTAARRRLRLPKHDQSHSLGFNTQPPEGGWYEQLKTQKTAQKFQHTAARRRLCTVALLPSAVDCFNTQPPEGGWGLPVDVITLDAVSTHSRPKAAEPSWFTTTFTSVFQHTAARRRLLPDCSILGLNPAFQHTAARRRLRPRLW